MSVEDRLRRGLAENARSIDASVERELAAVLARKRRRVQLRGAGYGAMAAAAAAVVTVLIVIPFIVDRPSSNPPSTPETGTSLAGRYVVDVASSAQAERLDLSGRWVVVLHDNGRLELVPPAGYTGIVSGSSYRVEGDQVRTNSFIDSPGCQREADQSGLYEWHKSAGIVEFEVARDDCAARRIIFSGQSWVSVP